MAKRDVKLFLDGKEVEFKTTPDILYNFNVDDVTSPAAVKNTFSKNIVLPATPKNNQIFGVFTENDYNGAFDPRKRMPFAITVNGDVYETGYARLTQVSQNKNYYEYNVSLFGGLGDFFYNLEYGEDGNKRNLSTLTYRESDSASTELVLDFILNRSSVASAFGVKPGGNDNNKWNVINFAPAYEGLPQDFDADKVLVNYHNAAQYGAVNRLVASGITSGGTAYGPYNGYALMKMPKERTMWEVRDFRSWHFRPVLSVKKTIEAICFPENNGGYEVELDNEFFDYYNPYYADAVVTLPRFSEMKISDYSTDDKYTSHTVSGVSAYNYNYYTHYGVKVDISPAMEVNASRLELDTTVIFSANTAQGATASTMYTSANITNTGGTVNINRNFGAVAVQLVAYAGTDRNSAVLGASNVMWLTSLVGDDYLRPDETNYRQYWIYGENPTIQNCFGTFNHIAGNSFQWSTGFTLSMDVPVGAKSFYLYVTPVANIYNNSMGYRARRMYTATAQTNFEGTDFVCRPSMFNSSTMKTFLGAGQTAGYSGAEITKGMLLDTDYSPGDFLLSYCKMFGLYFIKDPIKKKIKILTRKNFFLRNEVEDIQDKVDRSSVKITPLSFDSKWYRWQQEQVESEYADIYNVSTGKEYGEMDVNTEFAFNSDTKEVLDGNSLKSGVMALEKSNQYFIVDNDNPGPWMFSEYEATFLDTGTSQSAITVNVPKATTFSKVYMSEDAQYYDLFEKPVFHTENNGASDGKDVLLIYWGMKRLLQPNGQYLKCYLTDDVPEMGALNEGRACWLWTRSIYNDAGEQITQRLYSMPFYSRYKKNAGNGFVSRALDFGVPEKLYVPGIGISKNATVYNFFWREYIEDVFDRNSRVMECKMDIRQKPSVEMLRKFYWFDNSLWRMTNIKDYNAAADSLTTVTFIKVQDKDKYTSLEPNAGNLFLTADEEAVGPAAVSVPYHIITADNEQWTISGTNYSTTDVVSGNTDWDGEWSIPINYSTQSRVLTLSVWDTDDSDSVTIYQSGHTLNVYRCDSAGVPNTSMEINKNGETVYFHIVANQPWSFKAYPDASFIESMSCDPNNNPPTDGLIISCVIPRNPSIIDDRYTSFMLTADTTGYNIQTATYTQPDRGL